ncbi:hypothetical protein F5Y06DRAFT_257110 [Hypoxylon sp. FL0890]|nr:hypothetical protein F5Y06DRAFT_257110 [Hypoxylon sp. FL0890]
MDSLRQEACERFLHRVWSPGKQCDLLEISGSGNNIVHSEKTMPLAEIPGHLEPDSSKPTFKLVRFEVGIKIRNERVPYQEFSWFPDVGVAHGIERHMIGHASQFISGFQTLEREFQGEKVLNLHANYQDTRMIASYSPTTRCTTCFAFTLSEAEARRQYRYMADYIIQNKSLFQNGCFLPLVFMAISSNAGFIRVRGFPVGLFQRFDQDALLEWEGDRVSLRWAETFFSMTTDIAEYIRKTLDEEAEWGDPIPQVIADSSMAIREALNILECSVVATMKHVEWRLQCNDDYMARVARRLMREDTMASIDLTKNGIELTRAAKIDSSSMKVIAVMTMIFLPGTFFATLFAVPSLHWDNTDVVGENFWMYWAFTIPFTVLIVILWIAITQRKQMRSVLRATMKQWSAKSALLKGRWRKEEEEDAKEEEPKNV